MVGIQNVTTIQEIVQQFLINLNVHLPYEPTIPIAKHLLRKMKTHIQKVFAQKFS